jgi:hypothetical protein
LESLQASSLPKELKSVTDTQTIQNQKHDFALQQEVISIAMENPLENPPLNSNPEPTVSETKMQQLSFENTETVADVTQTDIDPVEDIIENGPIADTITLKNVESAENIIENTEQAVVLEKNNLIENESLHTILPVATVDKPETSFLNETPLNGYIVEEPLNVSKFKIKKNKPDDILETIKQYHNVRLDDAKRTLK